MLSKFDLYDTVHYNTVCETIIKADFIKYKSKNLNIWDIFTKLMRFIKMCYFYSNSLVNNLKAILSGNHILKLSVQMGRQI